MPKCFLVKRCHKSTNILSTNNTIVFDLTRREKDFIQSHAPYQPYTNSVHNADPSTTIHFDTAQVYTCIDCGKKYSSSKNMTRHRQTHLGITDKRYIRCTYCNKVYVSIPAFYIHIRTHYVRCCVRPVLIP